MKKYNTILNSVYLTAIIIITLSSCAPGNFPPDPYIVAESRQKENVYYAPIAQNVPLLSEKNDLSASIHFALSDKQSNANVQAAFLPSKNLGIMLSYGNNTEKDNDYVDMQRFELGVGYIKSLGTNWHFEAYGGAGAGSVDNIHHTGNSEIKTRNFFLQPAIAVENKAKTIQFAFVPRFNSVHFNIKDTTFINDREPFVTNQMKLMNDHPNQLFFEPGFLFRTGWKNIMLQSAYSFSTNLTSKDLRYIKDNFSIGIVFRVNTTTPNKETKQSDK